MIATQSGPIKIKNESGLKLRNNTNGTACSSAQKARSGGIGGSTNSTTKHKHVESRSSFTNVAQQILNSSIEGTF